MVWPLSLSVLLVTVFLRLQAVTYLRSARHKWHSRESFSTFRQWPRLTFMRWADYSLSTAIDECSQHWVSFQSDGRVVPSCVEILCFEHCSIEWNWCSRCPDRRLKFSNNYVPYCRAELETDVSTERVQLLAQKRWLLQFVIYSTMVS